MVTDAEAERYVERWVIKMVEDLFMKSLSFNEKLLEKDRQRVLLASRKFVQRLEDR